VDFLNEGLAAVKSASTYYLKDYERRDQHGKIKTHVHSKKYADLAADFANKTIATRVPAADLLEAGLTSKDSVINPLAVWYTSPKRREYDYITMDPRGYREHGKAGTAYNLYKGAGIELDECEGVEIPENFEQHAFFTHIRERWCLGNLELYEAVLNRFAHLIQKPWIKMQSTLVLRGTERCGKGMILQIVADILGQDYMFSPGSPESVFGNFNEGMSNCLMLFLDELVWGGDKTKAGTLKKLITEPHIYVNKKHMPLEKVDNLCNIFISSNEQYVIPAGSTDQRFQVLDVSPELSVIPRSQSTKICRAVHEIDMRALAKFFYMRDVSKWDHRRIINTAGLRYQKVQGMSPLNKWWLDVLNAGGIEIGGRIVELGQPMDKDAAYGAFKNTGGGRYVSSALFWKQIKTMTKIENVRVRVGLGKRKRRVLLSAVGEARQMWCDKYADDGWEFDSLDDVGEDSDSDSGSEIGEDPNL